MIYLLKDRDLYKVGFASDWTVRRKAYATHNPTVTLVNMCKTYKCTKHQLETAIHKEIKDKGFTFIYSPLTGTQTEWFKPSQEFAKQLDTYGLQAFKACSNRVMITA